MDVKGSRRYQLNNGEYNRHEINGICCKYVWLFLGGGRPNRDCQREVLNCCEWWLMDWFNGTLRGLYNAESRTWNRSCTLHFSLRTYATYIVLLTCKKALKSKVHKAVLQVKKPLSGCVVVWSRHVSWGILHSASHARRNFPSGRLAKYLLQSLPRTSYFCTSYFCIPDDEFAFRRGL